MAIRVEHRIGVAAPAEVIWRLLVDVERWPEWNPLYPEAKGHVRMGERLRLTEALPGRPPRQIAPVVFDWEPNNQILWRLNAPFARTVRYLEIEALAETGCIFANGSFHLGLVGEFLVKRERRALYEGYVSLGETVKRLSEQAWRSESAAAQ